MSTVQYRQNIGSLPRSHKFLLKLGNLLQVYNSKSCSLASLASDALSSSAIVEDGISVNSLDGSLKRYTNPHNPHAHNHPHPHTPTGGPPPITGSGGGVIAFRRQSFPTTMTSSSQEADASVHNNVMIPPEIAESLARDVSEAARYEPYGTRGCVVHVRIQLTAAATPRGGGEAGNGVKGNRTFTLGHVICDPDTVTTFEIEVTLREDDQRFLTKLRHLLPKRLFKKAPIIVSKHYSLKKKKLFRGCDDTTSAEE